ncbi:GGDEF domain-containing protein [Cognatiluteimonas profundi]|uniref:GGDEF domain-containing protein n=1 Tax=Cognatiluteimonas profundi TaxID=2594501 RepID=UPI00131C1DC5|nr:GGDEF domain-containing protein [Lysobacter profundi]
MDALTAAFALIIAQLCIALVMTGAHFAARPERSTRYWASAAILIVIGVLLVVIGNRAPSIVQLIGNTCLVFGGILQLWGLQVFFKMPRSKLAWMLGAGFCLLFFLLGLTGASTFNRILLLSSTMLLLLVLSCRVLLIGMPSRHSFGSLLTLGATALLMVNNIVRIAAAIRQDPDFLPMTQSPTGITILYLVPLGGIFLYATGLLLLYFERLVDAKNHLATHDELTGMLNRRAIVAGGEREVAVAIRSRQPLTVAFVDIDFFKRVNDNLGHEAGDFVLADIAQLLHDACRNVDLVGRYGGEEFCLVFPGAGSESVALLGERLLAAVRQYRVHDQHPITISVGFASLPDQGGDRSWSSLIHRADIALYQAKELGRNRFCVAAQEPAAASGEGSTRSSDRHIARRASALTIADRVIPSG